MKKILSLLFLLSSFLMVSQETKKDSLSSKLNPYASIGLSISNTNDFTLGSYPSLEIGLMGKNISAGLIIGRGSLKGLGEKNDDIANYFSELKTSVSIPISKKVGAYGLLGLGTYGNFKHAFIEYGAGFSYSFNKLSYFVQSSNWDGVWYVTPGITLNF